MNPILYPGYGFLMEMDNREGHSINSIGIDIMNITLKKQLFNILIESNDIQDMTSIPSRIIAGLVQTNTFDKHKTNYRNILDTNNSSNDPNILFKISQLILKKSKQMVFITI